MPVHYYQLVVLTSTHLLVAKKRNRLRPVEELADSIANAADPVKIIGSKAKIFQLSQLTKISYVEERAKLTIQSRMHSRSTSLIDSEGLLLETFKAIGAKIAPGQKFKVGAAPFFQNYDSAIRFTYATTIITGISLFLADHIIKDMPWLFVVPIAFIFLSLFVWVYRTVRPAECLFWKAPW